MTKFPKDKALKLVEEMALMMDRDANDAELMHNLLLKARQINSENKTFKKRVKYGLA